MLVSNAELHSNIIWATYLVGSGVVRPPGPEWVLSQSTLSARDPRIAELLESAKRVWPRILSYVRRQFNREISTDERDRLAIETWEVVLQSVARTLERRKIKSNAITDLDAYLVGAFQHRFIRAIRREKRRAHIVQSTAPEELSRLAESRGSDWTTAFERELDIKEIVASMDPWARDVWASYQYGYSWREIAARYGLTEQRAKMRFRYAILKAREQLKEASGKSSRKEQRWEDPK